MNNIFLQLHTDKGGRSQPIISMEAAHLINTIRLYLIKKPAETIEKHKAELLNGFASPDMDEKIRRSFNMKRLSKTDEEKIQNALVEAEDAIFAKCLELALPYIVVAYCRDDTWAEVRSILQEATGINSRIELPQFTSYQRMTPQQLTEWVGTEHYPRVDDYEEGEFMNFRGFGDEE